MILWKILYSFLLLKTIILYKNWIRKFNENVKQTAMILFVSIIKNKLIYK